MFEAFLSELDEADAAVMRHVVDHVAASVPEATEGRSYGLAAFLYHGKPLLGLAARANGLSLYPMSGAVVGAMATELRGRAVSKGTVRFTSDDPLPDEVLDRMVALRRAEIDGV